MGWPEGVIYSVSLDFMMMFSSLMMFFLLTFHASRPQPVWTYLWNIDLELKDYIEGHGRTF